MNILDTFTEAYNFNPITGKINDNLSVLTGKVYSCINEESNVIFINSIITSNVEYPILNTNNSRMLIVSSQLNNISAAINMNNSRSTILPVDNNIITQNQDNSFNNIINPHEDYSSTDKFIPTLYNNGNYLYWSEDHNNGSRISLNRPLRKYTTREEIDGLCYDLQGQTIEVEITNENNLRDNYSKFYNGYFHFTTKNNFVFFKLENVKCKVIFENITFKNLIINNCLNVKIKNCKFDQTSLNITGGKRKFTDYNQLTVCKDIKENCNAALYVENSKVFIWNDKINMIKFINCNYGIVADKCSNVFIKNNLYIKQFMIHNETEMYSRPIMLLATRGSQIFTGNNKFYTYIIYIGRSKLKEFNYNNEKLDNYNENNDDTYKLIEFTELNINPGIDESKPTNIEWLKYRHKDIPFVLFRKDITSMINHTHQDIPYISSYINNGNYDDFASIPTGAMYAYYEKQTANNIITDLLPLNSTYKTSGMFVLYNDVDNINAYNKPVMKSLLGLSATVASISKNTGFTIKTGNFKLS